MASELTVPFDIDDVRIVKSEVTKEGKLLITVESELKTTRCGCCGKEIACNDGHGQMLQLRHLPVFGMETYVQLRPKRAVCKVCWNEPKTTQVVVWYEQRSPHTKAYDEYLMKQLVNSTIDDVSLKEGIGYDAVVGALNRQVETSINWDEIDEIGTIGIDEIALKKGHKDFAAVLTSRQKNGKVRVLAVLPDRKKQA